MLPFGDLVRLRRAPDFSHRANVQTELTRVDLPVGAHSIGVHNILEARGELVGPDQGGRSVAGGDSVDKGRDGRSAFPLKQQRAVAT